MYALNYKQKTKSSRPFLRTRKKQMARAAAKRVAAARGRAVCVFRERKGSGGETYLTRIACYKGKRR